MLTLDGPIEAVTVYRDAAVVVRRAKVDLSAGHHQVQVVGLPLSLADASVRVEAVAEGSVTVGVAQVQVGLHVAPRDALAEPPDEAELRQVRRQLELVRRRLELVRGEQTSLRQLQAPDRPVPEPGKAPGPSPVTARLALDAFVMEGVAARGAEAHALEIEIEALERRLRDLDQRVQLASTAHRIEDNEVTKSAVCQVRTDSDVTVALIVRYQVPGSRWVPSYQVRVTDGRAEIALRALVAQRTGEDWSGVRLSVSTADVVQWTALPALTALKIGRQQAYEEPLEPRRPPEGADTLFADYDASRQRLARPGQAQYRRALPETFEPDRAPLFEEPVFEDRLEDDEEAFGVGGMAGGPPMVSAGAPEPMMAESAVRMDFATAEAMDTERPKRRKRSALARKAAVVDEPVRRGGAGPAHSPMLDALVLRGRDESSRGALVPVDPVQAFRTSLEGSRRSLGHVSPAALINRALSGANGVSHTPLPPGCQPPNATSGHFDYAYPARSPVDIPSDGAFHSVPLSLRAGPCEVTYVTVPRVDPAVYRQAQLRNPEASPLLAGPAEIYVDGEYVLTASLPTVPGQGDFELGLGVEQSVRCARNVRFREARSSDTVVATNDLHHELRYTLANDLDRPVQIEVRERVPIPGEGAEVVVEERDVEPPWSSYDQKERQSRIEGGRRWKVTVPARQEQALKATYVVRIYANHQIAGGNRRER